MQKETDYFGEGAALCQEQELRSCAKCMSAPWLRPAISNHITSPVPTKLQIDMGVPGRPSQPSPAFQGDDDDYQEGKTLVRKE